MDGVGGKKPVPSHFLGGSFRLHHFLDVRLRQRLVVRRLCMIHDDGGQLLLVVTAAHEAAIGVARDRHHRLVRVMLHLLFLGGFHFLLHLFLLRRFGAFLRERHGGEAKNKSNGNYRHEQTAYHGNLLVL